MKLDEDSLTKQRHMQQGFLFGLRRKNMCVIITEHIGKTL